MFAGAGAPGRVPLVHCVDALKRLVRTGWMMRGVHPAVGETVAAHSFEAAVLALFIAARLQERGFRVSHERAAVMALLHDLGECAVGDIPLRTAIAIGELKERLEEAKAGEVLALDALRAYVEDFHARRGAEARVARVAEKLATYLEAERLVSQGFQKVEEIRASSAEDVKRLIEEEADEGLRRALGDVVTELMEAGLARR